MSKKLTVLSPITHDGKDYNPGDKFEGSDEVVQSLIEAGALEDPNRPKSVQETSELEAAKAEAEKILADAKTEAEKIVEAAKAEAEKRASDGVVEASTAQEPAKSTEPSTEWKLDELKAYASDHGVENAQSFTKKQDVIDAIAKAQEPAS